MNAKPEQQERWEPVEGIMTPVARRRSCIHYRLLTLDQIVDVLSNQQPEAS